jgi:hypothetical protein
MNIYVIISIAIGCFAQGLFAGAALVVYGYKLGFKASYQIRNTTEGIDTDEGLLRPRKEPAEFELLENKE